MCNLTDRQLEAVMHLCNGKTVGEIAAVMYVSKSSVNQTIGAAKRRANAKTTAHLVSIVIASGQLYWTPEGRSFDDPQSAHALV